MVDKDDRALETDLSLRGHSSGRVQVLWSPGHLIPWTLMTTQPMVL